MFISKKQKKKNVKHQFFFCQPHSQVSMLRDHPVAQLQYVIHGANQRIITNLLLHLLYI